MPLHHVRGNWTILVLVCLYIDELRKNPPNSLSELVNTVERYAASLNKDQIITAVNDILPRAQACIESDGEAVEYKLKSFEDRFNREFFIADIFFSNVQHEAMEII